MSQESHRKRTSPVQAGRHVRPAVGSNAVEFTYCLVFIFFIILLPLANYGTFITRWAISSQIVSSWTNNLAKKRKLSEAFNLVATDEFNAAVANPTGVKVKSAKPALIVSRIDDPSKSIEVGIPGKIPAIWQPDAGNFEYTLQVVVLAQVDPLVTVQFFGMKIPGLTEPAEVVMSANALWENMGRDPITTEFYVNE